MAPWWGSKETLESPIYFHEAFGKRGQRLDPSPRNESGMGHVHGAVGRKGMEIWAEVDRLLETGLELQEVLSTGPPTS